MAKLDLTGLERCGPNGGAVKWPKGFWPGGGKRGPLIHEQRKCRKCKRAAMRGVDVCFSHGGVDRQIKAGIRLKPGALERWEAKQARSRAVVHWNRETDAGRIPREFLAVPQVQAILLKDRIDFLGLVMGLQLWKESETTGYWKPFRDWRDNV